MTKNLSLNTQGAIPPREWLRVAEAVAWSGLSKPKLYQLINAGLIKSASVRQR
jgi:predicted DNA-binding transcriptional regulator AlpA